MQGHTIGARCEDRKVDHARQCEIGVRGDNRRTPWRIRHDIVECHGQRKLRDDEAARVRFEALQLCTRLALMLMLLRKISWKLGTRGPAAGNGRVL